LSSWLGGLRKIAVDPAVIWSAGVFLGARLPLTGLGLVLWWLKLVPTTPDPMTRPYFGVPPIVEGAAGALLGVWQRFDAIHYVRIAAAGYSDAALSTFPPLYPILIRAAAYVTGGDAHLAALLVSNLACFLLLVVFHKLLVDENWPPPAARRAALYMLFFPTGFFLLVPYSESLFLLLCVISVRAARRGHWGWAGLAGLCAALARLQGLMLAPVLGLEVLRQSAWQPRRAGVRLLVALCPLIGVAAFVAWRAWVGLPSISAAKAASWSQVTAFPGQGVVLTVQRVLHGEAQAIEYVDLGTVLLMLVLGVVVVRRLPAIYGLYFWGNLLFNLTLLRAGQPLSGQARYSLTLFPAFMALVTLGRPAWLDRLALYPSTALWLFLAGQFALWGWVG
jgi:hypothetical protein